MGKGGGNTTSTVTQQNIPKEFYPYFERLLERGEALSLEKYIPYRGDRLAGINDTGQITNQDVLRSQGMIRDLAREGTSAELERAMRLTSNNAADARALSDTDPYKFSEFAGFQAGSANPYAGFEAGEATPYSAFDAYQADPYAGFTAGRGTEYTGFTAGQADAYTGFQAGQATPYSEFERYQASPFSDFAEQGATEYTGFQAGQATPYAGFTAGEATPYSDFTAAQFEQFGFTPSEKFGAEAISEYMNPYTQAVLEAQKKMTTEDYEIAKQSRSANAVSAGAFGGSRQAVAEAVAEGDMLDRMARMEAEGMQTAYTDAQRMFESDRAARLAAEQAQASEAGRFQSMSAGELARVQQAQAAEQARVQGISIEEAARVQQAEAAEIARTQGISIEEAARVQSAQTAERARVQATATSEAARVQEARAKELARVQQMDAGEFARVQQAQAAELARVQGISIEEAARVQQAEAAELARTQGISIEEAARVQSAQAAERARVQGIDIAEQARVQGAQAEELARVQQMDANEFARVQQSQAAELARVQGISIEEAARVQQAEAAELARVQGISIEEAARVQAANAAERARVQQSQAAENLARDQFSLSALGQSSGMANQLAQLSEMARSGDIQAAQLLEAVGRSNMSASQSVLDQRYADFTQQQQYPQQQLDMFSSLLRGLPIQNAGTTTQLTPYNPIQQALGMGISGLSLYNAYNGG